MRREPYRAVAARFHVSLAAIDRHVRLHIARGLQMLMAAERQSLAVQSPQDADAVTRPVLTQLRELHVRTLRILELSEVEKDRLVALGAVREARRNLELLARLTGELDPRTPGETGGALNVTIVYAERQMVTGQETPSALVAEPVAGLLLRPEGGREAGGPGEAA